MADEPREVLTIGHSNHPIEQFLELLRGAGVTAIADVRSAPHSRYVPQFNHDALKAVLRGAGIAHVYLGKELGGRPQNKQQYRDGVADYEKIAATEAFQAGLQRVLDGATTHRVALLCAEQHPLDCHRCLLVGRALAAKGASVRHILPDAELMTQADIEADLLRRTGRDKEDLFMSPAERLAAAYREYARKVAFAAAADPGVIAMPDAIVATIGFTQSTAEHFFERLIGAGVRKVVDVRLHNTSQLAGFAKAEDLAWFLRRLGGIGYAHEPLLAPTDTMLKAYRKEKGDWDEYARQFRTLMAERRVEQCFRPEGLAGSCLLCSEATPHHCHRRLVCEYLNEKWNGALTVRHL